MKKMKIEVAGKESSFDYNKIPRFTQEKLKSGVNIKTVNEETLLGPGNIDAGAGMGGDFLSVERLGNYLYRVSYDAIAPFDPNGEVMEVSCSAFVKDGKLYRNLDYNYDNTAAFWVKCKTFEGLGFIPNLEDGAIDADKIAQLPYHLYDGRNEAGIRVSAHLLHNDWGYEGNGEKSVPLHVLPYLILTTLESATSAEEVTEALSDYLDNFYVPETLIQNGNLFHFLVTDGTHTFVIEPPMASTGSYVVIEAEEGIERLTNFRYVDADVLSGYSDERLQDHPTGVERWNAIANGASLFDLRFTQAYRSFSRPSEFIGINETSKESTEEELEAIYEVAAAEFEARKRDGKTWHTMYSVVYSANDVFSLYTQENFDKNYATGDLREPIEISDVVGLETALSAKETTANKIDSLSPPFTEGQYPTAQATYEAVQDVREVAAGKNKNHIVNPEIDIDYVKAYLRVEGYNRKAWLNGNDITDYILNTETFDNSIINGEFKSDIVPLTFQGLDNYIVFELEYEGDIELKSIRDLGNSDNIIVLDNQITGETYLDRYLEHSLDNDTHHCHVLETIGRIVRPSNILATESDVNKVLKVDADGTPEWSDISIVVTPNSMKTVSSYPVPDLTVEQVTALYNGLAAGKTCVVTDIDEDENSNVQFKVVMGDATTGHASILLKYYWNGWVEYKVTEQDTVAITVHKMSEHQITAVEIHDNTIDITIS